MDLIMLGSGGHARSLADALAISDFTAVVVPTDALNEPSQISARVIDEDALLQTPPALARLVNGIGQTSPRSVREAVFKRLSNYGYDFATVIHPTAVVSPLAHLGTGAQVLAGAIVGPGASIGMNSTINSGAVVDHDCFVGAHVHVAPGAVLCGDVHIGDHSMIGAGSTVIPGIRTGQGSLLGAGATLTVDAPADALLVGVPARFVRSLRGSN